MIESYRLLLLIVEFQYKAVQIRETSLKFTKSYTQNVNNFHIDVLLYFFIYITNMN